MGWVGAAEYAAARLAPSRRNPDAVLAGLAARLAPSVRVPPVDSLAAAVVRAIALARAGGGAGAAETMPPPVDSLGLSAPLTRPVSRGRS